MRDKVIAVALSVMLTLAGINIYNTIAHPAPARAASQFANIICDGFTPISTSANLQIITAGNANMFVYVCSYNLNNGNAAAQAVSIVEGTGATCATNTKAMVGTTTAVNGITLGIAGTVNYGGGAGAVTKTTVAGNNVCLFTGAGPIAGVIGWTQMAF